VKGSLVAVLGDAQLALLGAGRDRLFDEAVAVGVAAALIAVDEQRVGRVGDGLVVDEQPDLELSRHALFFELVMLLGGAGLLAERLVGDEQLVALLEDVGVAALLAQLAVLRVLPDGLPEKPVLVGDAQDALALVDYVDRHTHTLAQHDLPALNAGGAR